MMDSILNVGINDEIVRRLSQVTGNQRFALNVHMKFLYLWGTVVLGLPKEKFLESITRIMKEENVTREFWLSPLGLQKVIMEFKKLGDAPSDPFEQLQLAIDAIFRSWQCPRYPAPIYCSYLS
jgi:pyruvate, orthophosphate dikinase